MKVWAKILLARTQCLICGKLRTTPTGAMEMLVGLSPFPCSVMQAVRLRFVKMLSFGQRKNTTTKIGHGTIVGRLMEINSIFRVKDTIKITVENSRCNDRSLTKC